MTAIDNTNFTFQISYVFNDFIGSKFFQCRLIVMVFVLFQQTDECINYKSIMLPCHAKNLLRCFIVFITAVHQINLLANLMNRRYKYDEASQQIFSVDRKSTSLNS